MSDFDPYYKWLGIPPDEQPPTHYRLLGIQVLEQNIEVIESAANRQMAYLQELSGGDEHIDEAQRLLGEVAKARVCLLNTESKAHYDAEIAAGLDSLPEAEDATDTADVADAVEEPAAERLEMKRSGRARRSSGGSARKTSAGRPRAGRTQKSGSSGSSKSKGGSKKKASNDLAIKIGALAGTAVFVLVVGILLLSGGGSDSDKKSKSKKVTRKISGSSTQQKSKPFKKNISDKKDADDAFDAAFDNFPSKGSPSPSGTSGGTSTPQQTAAQQETKNDEGKNIESSNAAQERETEFVPTEPNQAEKAEALLNRKGLEEGFNSEWKLIELTAAYEEVGNATGTAPKAVDESFEAELNRRIEAKKQELVERWAWLNSQEPDNGGPLDQEYNRTAEWLRQTNQGLIVTDTAGPIVETRRQLEAEYASQPASTNQNSTVNEAKDEIARQLRAKYAALRADAEIQEALEIVSGTLAEAPEIFNATTIPQAETSASPASSAGDLNAPESLQEQPRDNNQTAPEVAGDANGERAPDGESDAPTVSFEELEEELTALEKETKKTLGVFNKKAKAYISDKKKLVKRIKAGEALYAQRGRQQDAIQYPEEKTKFGQETEATVVKPLNALKSQLQQLTKPDTAPLEEIFKQSEKLIEQLKKTSVYVENPKSVDSVAAAIAKYRKGFEVQQTKMAK